MLKIEHISHESNIGYDDDIIPGINKIYHPDGELAPAKVASELGDYFILYYNIISHYIIILLSYCMNI